LQISAGQHPEAPPLLDDSGAEQTGAFENLLCFHILNRFCKAHSFHRKTDVSQVMEDASPI